MKDLRSWMKALSVALLVVVAFNGLLHFTRSRTLVHSRMRRIEGRAPGAALAFLGSSLVEGGIDEEALARGLELGASGTVLNAGVGSASSIERWIVARHLSRHLTSGTPVALGFGVAELYQFRWESPQGQWSQLAGNRSLGFFYERELAASQYTGGPLDRLLFEATSRIPCVNDRSATWGRVELFRWRLAAWGIPPEPIHRFGRARDFELRTQEEVETFLRRASTIVDSGDPFDTATRRTVAELHEAGHPLVFVCMPVHERRRSVQYDTREWRNYLALLEGHLGNLHGIPLIDASDWIGPEPEFWIDSQHLSGPGAERFSNRLGKELHRRGIVPFTRTDATRLPSPSSVPVGR